MRLHVRLPAMASAGVLVSVIGATILAANGAPDPQTKPATGPGSVPTKGPCRTYDTSVTSVTVGGPMKVTVEISGVFDPWSLRMVQNVSYTSNQGGRFQYVQESAWDLAEDFIAEVIRYKPPAGLPVNTSLPQAVNDIVPPLTRSRFTVATGQIGLTKTNYFDTENKLRNFNVRTGAGLISTTYSAWDSTGRPTAGTMKGPQSTSTVSIAYDDVALTQTETVTTMGITSVQTTTYDRQGNPRTMTATVTRGQASTTTWTPHSQATLCLMDLRAAPAPPRAPFGPNPNGTFTGTIGNPYGPAITSSMGVKAENNAGVVSVGGGDGRYLMSIAVAAKPGPGQYTAGPPRDVDFTKMTPEQFRNLFDHNTVVATVWDTQTKQVWQASPTIGSGSVNLTSIAGTLAGTFNLTLESIPNAGALNTGQSGSINFQGSFNVRY